MAHGVQYVWVWILSKWQSAEPANITGSIITEYGPVMLNEAKISKPRPCLLYTSDAADE